MVTSVPIYQTWAFLIVFVALGIGVLMVYRAMLYYQNECGIKRDGAIALAAGTMLAAAGFFFFRGTQYANATHRPESEVLFVALCSSLCVFFGTVLAVKLYRAWTGAFLTEAERAPGAEGVRAWLSPLKLFLVFAIAICGAKGLEWPFLGTLVLLVLALLLYPLTALLAAQPAPADTPAQPLKEEREKVLALLEAGKITAEESAELLNALGSTAATRPSAAEPGQQLAWVGAGLVLAGFFLPWLTVNPGQELNRIAGPMMSQMGAMQPQLLQTASVSVAGGDLPHGIGWLILLAGVAAALLPLVAPGRDAASRRMARLAALGTGSVLLLYVLTQNFRFLSTGVFVTLSGYVLLWISLRGRSAAI